MLGLAIAASAGSAAARWRASIERRHPDLRHLADRALRAPLRTAGMRRSSTDSMPWLPADRVPWPAPRTVGMPRSSGGPDPRHEADPVLRAPLRPAGVPRSGAGARSLRGGDGAVPSGPPRLTSAWLPRPPVALVSVLAGGSPDRAEARQRPPAMPCPWSRAMSGASRCAPTYGGRTYRNPSPMQMEALQASGDNDC
jgi:hypothetical protein